MSLSWRLLLWPFPTIKTWTAFMIGFLSGAFVIGVLLAIGYVRFVCGV